MATATSTTPTTPSTPTTPAVATLPSGSMSMPGVFAWFIAWAIVLGTLYGLSRTRAGKTIVYYVLWLSVVLVVVTHYSAISGVLTQGNITQGQQ